LTTLATYKWSFLWVIASTKLAAQSSVFPRDREPQARNPDPRSVIEGENWLEAH
jgi:hypothetical protein